MFRSHACTCCVECTYCSLLQKPSFVPVATTGTKGFRSHEKFLRQVRVEPKTSCLTHKFLTISTTHHIWLYMRWLLFVLTCREPFGPGWYHQPGQKRYPLVQVGGTTRDKRVGPFVRVGATNRDKRVFCPSWWLQPEQKAPTLPACLASRWTRDKSLHLSRVQRQPGQMEGSKAYSIVVATNAIQLQATKRTIEKATEMLTKKNKG